jgi:hypothetical protein
MDNWEMIGIVLLLLLVAGASLYSMRVQPVSESNVISTLTPDGHHVYSVNVSDSAKIKEGGA